MARANVFEQLVEEVVAEARQRLGGDAPDDSLERWRAIAHLLGRRQADLRDELLADPALVGVTLRAYDPARDAAEEWEALHPMPDGFIDAFDAGYQERQSELDIAAYADPEAQIVDTSGSLFLTPLPGPLPPPPDTRGLSAEGPVCRSCYGARCVCAQVEPVIAERRRALNH